MEIKTKSEIKEGRVGNLFLVDTAQNTPYISEVVCIQKNWFDVNIEKSFGIPVNTLPILIDEAWLIRLGFADLIDSLGILAGVIFVRWSKTTAYITIELEDGSDVELSHVKYIHQLQNLYFALTGKELTLKEAVA